MPGMRALTDVQTPEVVSHASQQVRTWCNHDWNISMETFIMHLSSHVRLPQLLQYACCILLLGSVQIHGFHRHQHVAFISVA
jgi:hypothetical protein